MIRIISQVSPPLTEKMKYDLHTVASRLQALRHEGHEGHEVEMCAEKNRAQMVDLLFHLTVLILGLSDKAYFSAVYILDCSLMVCPCASFWK